MLFYSRCTPGSIYFRMVVGFPRDIAKQRTLIQPSWVLVWMLELELLCSPKLLKKKVPKKAVPLNCRK